MAKPATKSASSNRTLPDPIAKRLRFTWSITTVVWKALCAALLPIRLEQLLTLLKVIVDHLIQHDPHRNRESALERTLRIWGVEIESEPSG